MRKLVKRLGGDRGSELIELAIVLPILLLVLAGIMDFAFLFQRWEAVTNAAREGARVGILPGYLDTDVRNRVQAYLNSGGLTDTPNILVSYTPITIGALTVNTVTVTVEYPSRFLYLGPIAGLVGGGFGSQITLRSVSVMRTEGAAGGGT
jgi:Flp pilus assembly protein TadG